MAESHRHPARFPLTADLAGVLTVTVQERAHADGTVAPTSERDSRAAMRLVWRLIRRALPRRRTSAGSTEEVAASMDSATLIR